VNPDLIKDVDLSVGGFNAEYGNIWGGSSTSPSGMSEGPLGGSRQREHDHDRLLFEGSTFLEGGFGVAGRRSYLELLKGFFDDFTSTPSFGDYQVKLDVQPTEKLSMNFQSLGVMIFWGSRSRRILTRLRKTRLWRVNFHITTSTTTRGPT
jgi:hypothetical protein